MITIALTERQAASIAAGLAALLRKESVTKEDQFFLTAEYTLVPLNDEDLNDLKLLFMKASKGVVDQAPPQPPTNDPTPSGMRMRG